MSNFYVRESVVLELSLLLIYSLFSGDLVAGTVCSTTPEQCNKTAVFSLRIDNTTIG